ncbi:hypothetical protein IMY05_018G0080400 [Salix suchowensis]|nr:hypothetical protein IMY05_018G0080400 [Salix suchowensis]
MLWRNDGEENDQGRTLCGACAAILCCSDMKTLFDHFIDEKPQLGYGIRDFAISGALEKNTRPFVIIGGAR